MPVSAFSPDGVVPTATSQYEKRGIAVNVPEWQIEHCIQCNQCAMVCPHAVIRPFLVKEGTEKPEFETRRPWAVNTRAGIPHPGSPLDCTGCGNCYEVCPAKTKALEMKPLDSQRHQEKNWEFAMKLPEQDLEPQPEHRQGRPVQAAAV